MGFGILFIGYFLLLNIAYFSFTDAISGILLLYALYKLSPVNREFKLSAVFAGAFSVLGVLEFLLEILRVFAILASSEILGSAVAIVRVIILGFLTSYMLLGMQRVAKEVGLRPLSEICGRIYILTLPIYGIKLALEVMGLFSLPDLIVLRIFSLVSIIASLTLTVLILLRIYACYMRICMPEDKDISGYKKERGGFIGAFRKHQEEKEKEYADYRQEKYNKKMEKRKGKKKK